MTNSEWEKRYFDAFHSYLHPDDHPKTYEVVKAFIASEKQATYTVGVTECVALLKRHLETVPGPVFETETNNAHDRGYRLALENAINLITPTHSQEPKEGRDNV